MNRVCPCRRSGQLLDQLLTAWEIREDDFHICNIVKCRPPGNRAPKPEEAEKCRPLLTRQFNLVRPRVILLMGGTAYKYFTHDDTGITKVRGRWIQKAGYWILPTFIRPMCCAIHAARTISGRISPLRAASRQS